MAIFGKTETLSDQARAAYARGDAVFQVAIEVASHSGVVVAMVGTASTSRDRDASETLNDICAEGWDLVNGTVVFVPTKQESRDKFLASGQQVAISGRTVGYYLFRRR